MEYNVVLQRFDHCPLGLVMAIIDNHIKIVALGDGVAWLWNQMNEGSAICIDDVLEEVNGISQDLQHMVRELRSAPILQMRLRRAEQCLQDEEMASRGSEKPQSGSGNIKAASLIEILLDEKEAIEDQIYGQKLAMLRLSVPGPHDDQVWKLASEWRLDHTFLDQDVTFLREYGFPVLESNAWGQCFNTKLQLDLEGHVEKAGHTWYLVNCSLQRLADEYGQVPGSVAWQAPRRLQQLRGDLHNRLKHYSNDEEESYYSIFEETPFARLGGVRGTTDRLKAWLSCLSSAVNRLQMSPAEVAYVLLFFHAPVPASVTNVKLGERPGSE